jgi:hypothetical protein
MLPLLDRQTRANGGTSVLASAHKSCRYYLLAWASCVRARDALTHMAEAHYAYPLGTVIPRYNDIRYSDIPAITIRTPCPI